MDNDFAALDAIMTPMRAVERAMAPMRAIERAVRPPRKSVAEAVAAINQPFVNDYLSAAKVAQDMMGDSPYLEAVRAAQAIADELQPAFEAAKLSCDLIDQYRPAYEAARLLKDINAPEATRMLDFLPPPIGVSQITSTLGFADKLQLSKQCGGVNWSVESLPKVRIKRFVRQETRITCAFCKSGLIWRVDPLDIDRREVVPICVTCQRRAAEDPEYLRTAFDAYQSVELEVIEGEGGGDQIPCGILTLVTEK